MKGQSSTEFIILLAAVSAFAVTILSLYAGLASREAPVYSSLRNVSGLDYSNMMATTDTASQLSVYVPSTTYLMQPARAYAIVYLPAGFAISNVTAGEAGIGAIQYSYVGQGNPSILSIPILLTAVGQHNVSVAVVAVNGSNTVALHAYGMTVTVNGSASQYVRNQSGQVSAYIARRNESLLYGLSSPVSMGAITQSSSCTMMNFWDQLWPIQMQCGDAKWEVRIFDDYCFGAYGTTRTYCFYGPGNGKIMQKVNYSYSPYYNISLVTNVGGTMLTANLSSHAPSSYVYLGNAIAGNAVVDGNIIAYGPDPAQSIAVLRSNAARLVNMSYYTTFQQYLNNVESMLAYYNNTGVDNSQMSAIQQAISAYDSYVNSTLPAQSTSQCIYLTGRGMLSCPPLQEFVYGDILERLNDSLNANETVYVDGSKISVR